MIGDVVISGKTITIHSLQSKQPLANYSHHRGMINSISINHNNKVIASCGQDGKIILVSAAKPQQKLAQHLFNSNIKQKSSILSCCAFSPNSKYLAVGSIDTLIKLWDNNSNKKQIINIKSHTFSVNSLSWLKNLKSDPFSTQILASASSGGQIYLHANKNGVFSQTGLLKMSEGINCVRTSQSLDFSRLAACTQGGTLSVWDLINSKTKPMWTNTLQQKSSMTSLAFSPFRHMLLVSASLNQTLYFYDTSQKKLVKKLSIQQQPTCVSLHPNGQSLIVGGMYGGVYVYDLRKPQKYQIKLTGHQSQIKQIEFAKPKEVQIKSNKNVPTINTNQTKTMSNIQRIKENVLKEDITKIQPNKPEPTKMNNNFISPPLSINSNKPTFTQYLINQQKKIQTRHSQHLELDNLKNGIMSNFSNKPISHLSQTGGSENFRARSKQIRSQHVQPANQQIKQMKQKITKIQKQVVELKNTLFDVQQRINLSLIRQFQLHQTQMRQMLQGFVRRQKQKDQTIKKLQAQNKQLKSSTF